MSTPAAVIPPTPENIHLYRAAALAWRSAWRVERVKDKLASPHIPLDAAAAVAELAPDMTPEEARTFAQRAVAWAALAHNAWMFGQGRE